MSTAGTLRVQVSPAGSAINCFLATHVKNRPQAAAESLADRDVRLMAFQSSVFEANDRNVSVAIVLAAGRGSRFAEASPGGPAKMMAPIDGVPMIRRTVESLDPKENSKSLTGRKLLGIIPFGRKVNNYFDKYRFCADRRERPPDDAIRSSTVGHESVIQGRKGVCVPDMSRAQPRARNLSSS